MDAYEVIKIVYSRVESMEPEHVSKIMGYFLFQDIGDQEMLRLALSSDALLNLHISKAKKELGLPISPHSQQIPSTAQVPPQSISHNTSQFAPATQLSPGSGGSFNEGLNGLYWDSLTSPRRMQEYNYFNFHQENSSLVPKFPLSNGPPASQGSVNVLSTEYVHPDMYSILKGTKFRTDHCVSRLNGSLASPDNGLQASSKPCIYFSRGYCKHGSTCRFLHSHGMQEPAFSVSSPNKEYGDECLSPWSLEKLEQELRSLLRGRRIPVSIASLPQLYFEMYGKSLQAEGYLTESQRHGKVGYSLTKLLTRLKNTVTLIDRPHGQHAVVLAEEAYKFLSYKGERDDLTETNPGSCQIYLTFPAESMFSEEDVADHFRVYGPVQDVRIPYQQRRMFGFVTFVYPETVKAILARGNPHFVCGARVLVKPYKEKGKHSERKLLDRESARFHNSSSDSWEHDFYLVPRFLDGSQVFRSRFEEQSQSIELEGPRIADSQVAEVQQRPVETGSHVTREHITVQQHEKLNDLSQTEELSVTTDTQNLQTSSAFGYLFDVLDSDTGEESERANKANTPKLSIEGHNLPDSPFTSPHCQEKITNLSFLEGLSSLTLGEQIGSRALTSVIPEGLICPLCSKFLLDPLQLDCKHTFCVQCILKVIRVSKDECPLCQRHIGSQIARLLESRGLRVIDTFLTMRGGHQIIW